MTIPDPLITGSTIYLSLAIAFVAAIYVGNLTGSISKDNAGIGYVVVIVAFCAMWMFWLCAWLHQWHPLIVPEYEADD